MIQAIVDWFQTSQRLLPWRKSYDPYHVWVSEVMLQQTQVDTALPYYSRFLKRFPRLQDFAETDESEVLQIWSGLGYYNRARNFQQAAKRIVTECDGAVPRNYDKLLSLPGIGRYMAGAIMSIAFNEPYPIVDGNVRRVLSRLNGWTQDNPKLLWDAASEIVQSAEPRIVNQAMMELGATVCTFRTPSCETCPVRRFCKAYASGNPIAIPTPRKRQKSEQVHFHTVIDQNKNGFLMQNIKGFWEFPAFSTLPKARFTRLGCCRHQITHHKILVDVHEGKLENREDYHRVTFSKVPVTSLTRKILEVVRKKGQQSNIGKVQ